MKNDLSKLSTEDIKYKYGFNYLLLGDFNEGPAWFRKNKKYGLIGKDGIILAEGFDDFGCFYGKFAGFKKNGKEGYIDTKGNLFKKDQKSSF